jgi:hypothetical protein
MNANPLPVRTALDVLALDFPLYHFAMGAVGDKMFYFAEATGPQVQPRFAQAETTDRLRAKLSVPMREFTTVQPSIPRVWDVLLDGKDNFAADREQAAKLLAVFPRAAELARESREFQRRAVAYVAGAGVRQFADIGCGLPTSPATHEVAQETQPGSVVVYADNDELVMSHARNILARTPGVLAVAGDITHPDEIMYDWRVRQAINFHEPVCLVVAMTLHFFDAATAPAITGQLIASVPPGSYLVVSVGQLEGEISQQFSAEYQAGNLHHHTREDIAGFLHGLQLTAPGVTEARAWRPPVKPAGEPRRGHVWAAVGRKPDPENAGQP